MKILLAVFGLVSLILLVRYLMTRGGSGADETGNHLAAESQESPAVRPREHQKHPPSSGSGDPLEMIRAALPSMSSEDIENLLDMEATLKPGAEELFRTELKRRREEEADSS